MNKVIVAGSINMDIVVFVERHPSIGETVFGTDLKYFPGGKGANQAISSAKLGVKTILIGKVGKDIFGNKLVSFLNKQNIENKISIEKKKPTGVAIIAFSGGEIIQILGKRIEAVDTTGAGDCFVGAFAANLAKGKSLFESLNVANIAASISVTKEGAGSSMPTFYQVNKEITQGSPV